MALLMLFPGIDGTVLREGRKWIQLSRWQYGNSKSQKRATRGSDVDESRQEIIFFRNNDGASKDILRAVNESLHADKVIVQDFPDHPIPAGTPSTNTNYNLVLNQVLAEGFALTSGGDKPQESFTCSYVKMKDPTGRLPLGFSTAWMPFGFSIGPLPPRKPSNVPRPFSFPIFLFYTPTFPKISKWGK
jgi:hypothetical protein